MTFEDLFYMIVNSLWDGFSKYLTIGDSVLTGKNHDNLIFCVIHEITTFLSTRYDNISKINKQECPNKVQGGFR